MNTANHKNRTLQARNPRTGEMDYSFETTGEEEIISVVADLRKGQPAWAAMSVQERAKILSNWADAVASSDELLQALVTDTGRYFIASAELGRLSTMVQDWLKIGETIFAEQIAKQSSAPTVTYKHQLVPFEVVGVIGPWNFPFLITLIDLVPALMAGSAVVVKPSEITPRFIAPLQKILEQIPALNAVCRFIEGDGQTGQDLIKHVDALCFTGSVKTGKIVYQSGAENFIPIYAELGGKDPVIITENADPKDTAKIVLRASVQATGQACQSIERVYIQSSIAEAFTSELVRLSEQVKINYPDVYQGHIGPLIFDKQAEIIQAHLKDAEEKGAEILCGGLIEQHGGGLWILPTVLKNVDHSMLVMNDETFGPIIPIMTYSDVNEAIELANDTQYGLSAAVLAGDRVEAERIAMHLDAGAISIQDCGITAYVFDGEKNWFKYSGTGASRMGQMGMIRFFRKKVLYTQSGETQGIDAMGEQKPS